MSFDKLFDLTAGVYFYFYNIPAGAGIFYMHGGYVFFPRGFVSGRHLFLCVFVRFFFFSALFLPDRKQS